MRETIKQSEVMVKRDIQVKQFNERQQAIMQLKQQETNKNKDKK